MSAWVRRISFRWRRPRVFVPSAAPSGGAVAISHPTVAGSGTFTTVGTGGTTISHPTISGAGTFATVGSGAVTIGHPSISGADSINPAVLVFEGDSLTAGNGASSGQGTATGTTYPGRVVAGLTGLSITVTPTNSGVGGQLLTDMIADEASATSHYDTAAAANVVAIWGGTNDINSGASAATVESRLQTIWTDYRTAGFKVIAFTIIARGDFGSPQNTVRAAVNTWISANWPTYCDRFVDVDADARLQTPSNTTYFNADTIHLTDVGYQVVADLALGKVRDLVAGILTATGAVTISHPTISGAGTFATGGTGAVSIGHPIVDGAGTFTTTGTGALAIGHPSVDGSGIVSDPGITSGTGNVTVGHPAITGAGTMTTIGAGGVVISHPTINGTQSTPPALARLQIDNAAVASLTIDDIGLAA